VGIVGDRPESGVRIALERPAHGGPPWSYAGEAVTPEARFALSAVIAADGTVAIELQLQPQLEPQLRDAPAALVEKVRLLVRAAWKHAHEDGAPPPRRIVRWRADR
jgi:hypothetical protein